MKKSTLTFDTLKVICKYPTVDCGSEYRCIPTEEKRSINIPQGINVMDQR
jgi:hypothetical protein